MHGSAHIFFKSQFHHSATLARCLQTGVVSASKSQPGAKIASPNTLNLKQGAPDGQLHVEEDDFSRLGDEFVARVRVQKLPHLHDAKSILATFSSSESTRETFRSNVLRR